MELPSVRDVMEREELELLVLVARQMCTSGQIALCAMELGNIMVVLLVHHVAAKAD